MELFLALVADLLVKFQGSIWFQVAATIVTAATAALVLWPMPKEGSVLWYIRKLVEFLSGNIFNDKKATTDNK